jgi:choline dehydrogenase-like flavoprotein
VVVLEQGGWGKYGKEHEYTKDEWLNDNLSPEDRLLSDPTTQRNTFRRTAEEKAAPGSHSYGCVVGGGTVTYGGSSWRHLPYEFNELSTVGAIAGTGWPTGRSHTRSSSPITPRPNGKWASRDSGSTRRLLRR